MSAIEKIIENKKIVTLYQPIYEINKNELIGYEALSRGPNGFYYYPKKLFTSAWQHGCLPELELVCAKKALERYPGNKFLFINFSDSTISRCYNEICKNFTGIIIEISEVGSENKKKFKKIIQHLLKNGIYIALDDVGNGSRDFYRVCELPTSYLKIDKKLVQGMTDYVNAKYYKTIVNYINNLAISGGIELIAEGVENFEQLQEVKNAGIKYAQGFYFSNLLYPEELLRYERRRTI